MALYRLDDTGEAVRVDMNEFMSTRRSVDETSLTLARHDIIEAKSKHLGDVIAVDAIRGKYHNGRVIATVVTKLRLITDMDDAPPWETMAMRASGSTELMYRSRTREQAIEAHKSAVNMLTKEYGGRVLIR